MRISDAYTRGEYPTRIRAKSQYKELTKYIQISSFIDQLQEHYKVMNYYIKEDKGQIIEDNTFEKEDESTTETPRRVQYIPAPTKSLNLKLIMQTQGHQ